MDFQLVGFKEEVLFSPDPAGRKANLTPPPNTPHIGAVRYTEDLRLKYTKRQSHL